MNCRESSNHGTQQASGLVALAAGSLPLLLQHVVSPKQHRPEEYRLLLKLLHHASHLQVCPVHLTPVELQSLHRARRATNTL